MMYSNHLAIKYRMYLLSSESKMRFKVTLFTLTTLLISFNLQAKLGVGIGFAKGQSPYRDVASNPNTIPGYLSYEGSKGYFRGIEGGVYLWSQGERGKKLTLSLLAAGRLEGYKASDSGYLSGMKTRQWSLDAGAGATLQRGFNRYTAKVLTDTLGRHKGQSFDLGYAYVFPATSKLLLIPGANVTWQSSNLLDYYFGVTNNEAQAGRNAYKTKDGVQLRASLLTSYKVSPNTSFTLLVTTRKLAKSVTASPLVDRNYLSGVFGALNYSF